MSSIVGSCVPVTIFNPKLHQTLLTAEIITVMLLLRCTAWLLVVSCLSTVAGVPVSPTNATATTTPVGASVTTHNATNGTSVSPGLKGLNESGETLAGDASEGDLLLEEARNAVNTLWSGGIIPFTISPEIAYQSSEIEEAFGMIMSVSCIRFVPRTNEMNYIEIKDGQGCASFVGCRGGIQPVYFGHTCSAGNLCHELLHTAGFHHEHTRWDRDDYVLVNWQSIKPAEKQNFEVKEGNTLNLPYDLESIMHYGPNFFSLDGRKTLQPLKSGVEIGQRTHLSNLDIRKLNRLYRCGGK